MSMVWREVSYEEFFTAIVGKDVHPHLIGKWPYTSLFRTKAEYAWGKIEEYIPSGSALSKKRYFLRG